MQNGMFRKVGIGITGIIILCLCAAFTSEAQRDEDRGLSDKEMKRLIKEAKEKLDNTAWNIELAQSGKNKKETDSLKFKNNQIESDKLIDEGFQPTNYTIRIKGENNDIVVWETMQTSEDKGIAFWRGEITDDVMRGVLSWHISEKDKREYTFRGTGKETSVSASMDTPKKVMEEPVEVSGEMEQQGEPDMVEMQARAPVEKVMEKETAKASEPEPAPEKKKRWWNR